MTRLSIMICLLLVLLVGGCGRMDDSDSVETLPEVSPSESVSSEIAPFIDSHDEPNLTEKQEEHDEGTYDIRVRGVQDYAEYLPVIYRVVEYYAGLDFQKDGALAYELPLTEEERDRVLEIVSYTESTYKRLTAKTISNEELTWYVDMGIVEAGENGLTEKEYPIIRKGEYGHIPYVVVDGEEYCLLLEEPDEFDASMHEQYFKEIQYDVMDIAYSAELNRVTAIVTSSLGGTYEIRLNFNQEGIISRTDRMML